MWMYSGLEDTTRIHPEEVNEDILENWLRGITGNKDNHRGSRSVIPFDNSHEPEQVYFCFIKYLSDSPRDVPFVVD